MKRKVYLKAALIIACALIVLAVGLVLLRQYDQSRYSEQRGEMSEGFGELRTVEWNGEKYQEKPAVTTLLIAGIDKTEDNSALVSSTQKYRNGGQSDFLVLLAIDHTEKKIHQLQIDRDTMTDVVVLGVFGNETGTRKLQICLSHSFGETPEDNAKYTIRAVQNLLGGIEIDGYYMFNYNAVPVLNDMLGGVKVTIREDMTSVNPAWTEGTVVTLRGKDAERFVRARRSVGSGTNQERMTRQNEYMRGAISQMNKLIAGDPGFGESLLSSMQNLAETNMSMNRLVTEIDKAHAYEVLEVDHLDGEYVTGQTGFTEFHMKENAAVEWVLDHIYTKQ